MVEALVPASQTCNMYADKEIELKIECSVVKIISRLR